MGVKHFFIWLRKNFPETIDTIKYNETFQDHDVSIDNLCLDMNGIFHTCAQKVYQYGSFEKKSLLRPQAYKKGVRWQIKLFEEVCKTITHYKKIVNPKKRLILCVDGVAGRAKMNQQRARRYKSEPMTNCDFDTSSITPGTRFMDNLSRYIEWYCRVMLTNDIDWEDIEIIYSGDKVSGEGEHKIINYIRNHDNGSESYCIHGLDADLIMLSLSTKLKSMYVLRENIRNHSELHLVDIGLLSTQISYHLKWDRERPHVDLENTDCDVESVVQSVQYEKFSNNNSIDDFVFMCFLVGNDFVPTIPTLAILDGGLDSMIDVYKNTGKSYGHLTRITRKSKDTTVVFRQKALEVFLGTLASYEAGLMEEKYNKREDFIEDPLLKMSMGPVHQDSDGNYKQSIDFDKYKTQYYKKKLNIDITESIENNTDTLTQHRDITNICENYLRGLQWVLTYYKKGMPDWEWCYEDFYAPFLCDLAKVAGTSSMIAEGHVFEKHSPVDPYLQLTCVLPPRSRTLLPEPLCNLLNPETSPIKQYIPETIEVDCSGKRQEWEGIVLVPIIQKSDMDVIRKHYNTYIKHTDAHLLRLNTSKQTIRLKHNSKVKNFIYKSYYGDIPDCKVKVEYFDLVN
jgi:5'-3' exoribonuclease 1